MTSIIRFDENTRKSLGRRVSFANHAHVLLFEVTEQNTNSTASPQSSPAAEIESYGATDDENAYPGASSFKHRSFIRQSIAFSEGGGEELMDMDSDDRGYSPAAFFRAGNNFDEGDYLVMRATTPTTIWTRQKLYHIISCNDVPHLVYPASHLQTSLLLRRPWITKMKRWMRHLWRCHL